MRHLSFHLLTFALLCSCVQDNGKSEDRDIPFGFSDADEIEEFYDAGHTIKKPVFPGGNDSLRCYLVKNIRYDEKLFNPETPNYLTIEYIVGPDCSITFPKDCIIGKDDWPTSIEHLYYNSEEALDSMIEEAKRVIGNLKYKKPAMKRDNVSGVWIPTSIKLYQHISFKKNLEASLYNKDSIIAEMERFPTSISDDLLRYRRLRQLTTDKEKIKLLKYSPSYEVKVNAAVGLIKSGNPAFEELLPQLLSDPTLLYMTDSDVIHTTSVYFFFISVLQEEKIDPEIRKRVEDIIAKRHTFGFFGYKI